jgi:hypothetical protein
VRSLGCHSQAARLLSGFKHIHESLIGREAAKGIAYDAELKDAFAVYQKDLPEEWAKGRTISYEEIVNHAMGSACGE